MLPFSLLLYVFASFGASFVLGNAKISLPFREAIGKLDSAVRGVDSIPVYPAPIRFLARWLLSLLECPACVSFWLGVASVLTPIGEMIPMNYPAYYVAPFLGLANCGAVLALGLSTRLIRTE